MVRDTTTAWLTALMYNEMNVLPDLTSSCCLLCDSDQFHIQLNHPLLPSDSSAPSLKILYPAFFT